MPQNINKAASIQRVFTEIKALATTFSSIEKIILFGSRARGDNAERSDIDIAIVAPTIKPAQWLELLEKIDNLNTLLEIDVVNFDEVDEKLKSKIRLEGKVIYEHQ